MKTKLYVLISIVAAIIMAIALTGCNKQMIDLNYSYNYAIIALPNGEVKEGKIKSWTDYEDGEQLQITFTDGSVHLTSSYRCELMKK